MNPSQVVRCESARCHESWWGPLVPVTYNSDHDHSPRCGRRRPSACPVSYGPSRPSIAAPAPPTSCGAGHAPFRTSSVSWTECPPGGRADRVEIVSSSEGRTAAAADASDCLSVGDKRCRLTDVRLVAAVESTPSRAISSYIGRYSAATAWLRSPLSDFIVLALFGIYCSVSLQALFGRCCVVAQR